jgi:hypothetical protein
VHANGDPYEGGWRAVTLRQMVLDAKEAEMLGSVKAPAVVRERLAPH